MYLVDVYLRVRRAVMVEGMSIREASRVFGLHRDTVRKMVAYCRWSTIMSVVNRSGKMSVHERIDIDPERTGKAPSAQRYPGVRYQWMRRQRFWE